MAVVPKVSIEVAKETVQDVVDAALTVFSPAIEPLGWLGDQIRVHRVRSSLKTFKRTQELARECKLKLKAPPAKFLAQFIEASSLEEADDDDLIERWASLLLNASNQFNSEQTFYVSVLKHLGAIELELLEVLARGEGAYRLALIEEAAFVFEFQQAPAEAARHVTDDPRKVNAAIDKIIGELAFAGVMVADVFVSFALGQGDDSQWQNMHKGYLESERVHWEILKASNLISEVSFTWQCGPLEYRVRAMMFTELGARFYFACHRPGWRDKISNKVPYKRRYRKHSEQRARREVEEELARLEPRKKKASTKAPRGKRKSNR